MIQFSKQDPGKYLDLKEKASLVASKYDWFIAYDFYISKNLFEKIVEFDERKSNNKEIDVLFFNYYGKEARNQIVNDLKDIEVIKEYEEILTQVKIMVMSRTGSIPLL